MFHALTSNEMNRSKQASWHYLLPKCRNVEMSWVKKSPHQPGITNLQGAHLGQLHSSLASASSKPSLTWSDQFQAVWQSEVNKRNTSISNISLECRIPMRSATALTWIGGAVIWEWKTPLTSTSTKKIKDVRPLNPLYRAALQEWHLSVSPKKEFCQIRSGSGVKPDLIDCEALRSLHMNWLLPILSSAVARKYLSCGFPSEFVL